MKILKKLTSASLILATTVNLYLPIFSRASYIDKAKLEMPYNNISSSIVENIDDEENIGRYSKAYQEYSKLSDEEKANIDVIPRKYDIPFDEIYNIIEKQEKEETMNLLVENDTGLVKSENTVAETSLPTVYDLRDVIDVKVENQGDYGLCWAFAANSALETTIALRENVDEDFSELHVDYLTSNEFNYNSTMKRELHDGGNFEIYLEYVAKNKGPVFEENVPYDAVYDIDAYEELLNLTPQAYIQEAVNFPSIYEEELTEDEIKLYRDSVKQHIINYGALSANVNMDYGYNYETNALNNTENYIANHAITIIGWDDSYSKENFQEGYQPQNDGAYIVLNSWGEEFGDAGIFYVSYEDILIDTYVCGFMEASSSEVASDTVQFEDMNLYEALKVEFEDYIVNYNDNSMTIEFNGLRNDILYQDCLDLSNLQIENISGLEYFSFCTELDLSYNSIRDITPLKDFSHLYVLDLSHNPIESDLSLIPDVDEINLSSCSLTNIDNLITDEKTRDYLTILNLSGNDITDVSILSELDSEGYERFYSEIDLSGNKNLDLSTWTFSTSILRLEDCDLTDESLSLLGSGYVEELDLAYNSITDITPLIDLGIYSLDISYTNVELLPEFPALYGLKASGNPNIDGLGNLSDLSELTLTNCNLENLDKIKGINLYLLNLSDNNLTDISDLVEFQNLEFLTLDNNSVDFSTMPQMESLMTLSLVNNNIDDISSISFISDILYEIDLSNNSITDMSPLSELQNDYLEVNLNNNQISEFIMNKTDYVLNLDNNQILEVPTDIITNADNISFNNQDVTLDSVDLKLNQQNQVDLPEIISRIYNDRYKTNANIVSENCTIDYENGKIIIEPTTLGENTCTIEVVEGGIFTGSIYTLNYNVVEEVDVVITGIEIAQGAKINYVEGENFDTTGLVVNAIYSDDTYEEIFDYEIINGENLQKGQDSVTIKYGEYEVAADVAVYSEDEIEEIIFNDENLFRVMLNIVLQHDAGMKVITVNEAEKTMVIVKDVLEEITQVSMYDIEITDLTGLSKFYNLQELALTTCMENDIAELQELTNLETLSIEVCGLTDISIFENLTNLKNLHISSANITDIGNLLEQLERFSLTNSLSIPNSSVEVVDNKIYMPQLITEMVNFIADPIVVILNEYQPESETELELQEDENGNIYVDVDMNYIKESLESGDPVICVEITDEYQNYFVMCNIEYTNDSVTDPIVPEEPTEPELYGIEIAQGARINYIEGEDFDTTGLIVYAVYSDDTYEQIYDYEIINGENLQKGQDSVIIKYGEYEVAADVAVYSEGEIEEITFNDENLFRVMLNIVLQQDAETKVISVNEAEKKIVIVKDVLEAITQVSMYDIEITDLTGLSKFYNIQELTLTNYKEEFLLELQGLSNLQTLAIMVCELEDISDFESLTSLKNLNIWSGPVTNIGSILENLEYFSLTSDLSIGGLEVSDNKIYMPQVITEMIEFIEEPTVVVLNEYEEEDNSELELQEDENGNFYVEVDMNAIKRTLENGDSLICVEVSDEYQNYFVMCNIAYEEIDYEYEITDEFILNIAPKTPIADFKAILLEDEGYNVIVKDNEEDAEETDSEYVKTGMHVIIVDSNEEVISELTAVVKGDMNGDGKADGNDWLLLKGYRTEVIEFTPEQIEAADLNDDGTVNYTDSKLLLLHRAEVIGYDLNYVQ